MGLLAILVGLEALETLEALGTLVELGLQEDQHSQFQLSAD
jgi:hypothetical protein